MEKAMKALPGAIDDIAAEISASGDVASKKTAEAFEAIFSASEGASLSKE
jgi:hypothetical protein